MIHTSGANFFRHRQWRALQTEMQVGKLWRRRLRANGHRDAALSLLFDQFGPQQCNEKRDTHNALTYSLSLTHSLIHSRTHSLTHAPRTHSLAYSLTHSFSHPGTHSLTAHSLTRSVSRSLTPSLPRTLAALLTRERVCTHTHARTPTDTHTIARTAPSPRPGQRWRRPWLRESRRMSLPVRRGARSTSRCPCGSLLGPAACGTC